MECLSSHSCMTQPSLRTGSFILQYHRQLCLGRDEGSDVFLPFCFGMVCSVYAMESSFLCERWDIEGRGPTWKTVIHQAIFGCMPTVYHAIPGHGLLAGWSGELGTLARYCWEANRKGLLLVVMPGSSEGGLLGYSHGTRAIAEFLVPVM